jgi:hypothetical protein
VSKCISSGGEYSEHEMTPAVAPGLPPFSCVRCWAFDEDTALAALDRAREVAVALEQRLARVEGIAHEAILSVGIGGHSHWREGGSGGQCSACDLASQVRADLRAALEVDQ